MKKVFLILVFGLLLASTSEAQFAKPLKSRSDAQRSTHPFSIGVTGSFAANDMMYTSVSKSKLTPFLGPTFGIAAEWNAMNGFAVGLDASYAMRGTNEAFAVEFLTSFSSTTFAHVNYSLAMNGVEIRLPFTYYFGGGAIFKPYVYVAPRFNLWLNGNIKWERTYEDENYAPLVYEKELDDASLAPYDLGAVAGLGVGSRITVNHTHFFVKFDLSYGMGLMSNFSQHEVEGNVTFQGWGDIQHETLGKRYLRNVEARLTLLIPLRKPLKDACSFDQRMRKGR